MPTFAPKPVRPYYAPPGTRRVRQGAPLSGQDIRAMAAYYPANFFVPTPMNVVMHGRPSVGLTHYALGDMPNPGGAIFGTDQGAPPAPPAPGLPAGYDANTGMIAAGASGAAPPVMIGPMAPSIPAPGTTLAPGTFLTYTVNYALQGVSNFFTSNDEALSSITPMLGGVGLVVVNSSTPASINPFSTNQAVLTLQVAAQGLTLQSAKALCDNAIVNGIGAQILSSSLTVGQANTALTWISQNWQWVAAGAAALLLLPKLLDL
jgi:hypothetical protein